MEANGTTVAVGQNQLVIAVRQSNAHHLIALININSNHTVVARTAVGL